MEMANGREDPEMTIYVVDRPKSARWIWSIPDYLLSNLKADLEPESTAHSVQPMHMQGRIYETVDMDKVVLFRAGARAWMQSSKPLGCHANIIFFVRPFSGHHWTFAHSTDIDVNTDVDSVPLPCLGSIISTRPTRTARSHG